MYKPTGFLSDISMPIFTYSSNWADSKFFHKIHQPDIFKFYSLASTSKQGKGVEHFGAPREFWENLICK